MGEFDRWSARLLSSLAIGLSACCVWIWVQTYYLGQQSSTILSSTANDKPVPGIHVPGFNPVRILGGHYFGDFQEPLSWITNLLGNGVSPYTYGVMYPPLAILTFWPFHYLPVNLGTAIFLFAMFLVVLIPLWLLLPKWPISLKVLTITLIYILTVPAITAFDRGNVQPLVGGVIALSILAASSKRYRWSGLFGAIALSLKGYPGFLLIIPGSLGRWRWTAWVLFASVIGSAFLFALFPGGLLENSTHWFANANEIANLGTWESNYSFSGFTYNLIALKFGRESASGFMSEYGRVIWMLGLFWLVGCWFIIRSKRIPEWAWGCLALASLQLVMTTSYAYTTVWAPIAAAWFMRGSLLSLRPEDRSISGELNPRSYTILRWACIAALVATLSPIAIAISSVNLNVYLGPLLSPLALLATWILTLTFALKPKRLSHM